MLLEDYGLIGDMQSAELVGRDGSVDWLCLPQFDSASCFSGLLGDEQHGRWLLAPVGEARATTRRYRPGTLVLETELETADGAVRVIDFMPPRMQGPPRVMRIVEGVRGRVPMRMELSLRPDYGSIVPWVEPASDGTVGADFSVVEGARERLTLTWHLSYEQTPPVEDADSALARTQAWWREWSGRCRYEGPYGSRELDASVLNIPLVGFLPGEDERVTGTIDAITAELGRDGFVSRYSTAETDDGLPGDEGQFLACSFWLVSALALNGRVGDARSLFERLLGLTNDLGLLAEEYDVARRRQVGNFPQAFSHLTLILAARPISQATA